MGCILFPIRLIQALATMYDWLDETRRVKEFIRQVYGIEESRRYVRQRYIGCVIQWILTFVGLVILWFILRFVIRNM